MFATLGCLLCHMYLLFADNDIMLSPNLSGRKWDRKSWGPTTTSWYLTPPDPVACGVATPRLVRREKKERSVSPIPSGGRHPPR